MPHVPLLRAFLPPRHHAQPLPTVHLPCRKGIAVTLWEPPTTPKSANEPPTKPGIMHNPTIAKGQTTSMDIWVPAGCGLGNSQSQPQVNTCI